jgi:hypothetical protein
MTYLFKPKGPMAYNWIIANMKKIFFNVLVLLTVFCLPVGLSAQTIVASAGEHGTISPAGNVAVLLGDNAEFTITPESGYRIASVVVDAETANEVNVTANLVAGDGVFFYTFENVTADHTINATFEEIPTYTITVVAGENGSVLYNDALVSEPIVVAEGATPEFEISPATGYQIEALSIDENAIALTPVQLGGYTYTFEPVMAAHTITVSFELIPVVVTTHTIVATAGENGTITPNGNVDVEDGEDQVFQIAANDGYRIASVLVDDVEAINDLVNGAYTFTNVTEDHTIAATFEAVPVTTYTITGTVIGGHGSIVPDGSVDVNAGETYEVRFVPDENYAIDTVKDNGFLRYPVEGTGYIFDNVYTLTNVSENHEIIVVYKDTRTYYNIHVEVETAGGDVTPRDTSVVGGSDVTINVMPLDGYRISRLEIDGNILNNCETNEISFRDVQADHNIKIAFLPNSIDENVFSSLSVYPNPNNGMFSIDLSNIEGAATYQLIDARGAVVETREINVANGETKMFNHKLDAGTYIVRIIAGDKVYVEQIVVE